MKIRDITEIGLFSALICIGAFIKIPLPTLSVTMQVFFVLLAGLLLGRKKASCAVEIYILTGLVGLPVFSEGGGVSYVFNPRFGYLVGFVFSAYIMGAINEKRFCLKKAVFSCAIGIACIYFFGMSWYYIICRFVLLTPVSISFIFVYCFLSVILGDVLSAAAAVFAASRIKKYIV